MNNKTKGLFAIVALSLSFGLGYFATPSKIKTKEVVKTETVKVEGKTRIVYRDRIIHPDGTIVEKEVEREDSNTRTETSSNSTSESSVTKDTGLTLGALAITDVKSIGKELEYGVHVSKRVLGALSVNALVTTDKKVGLGLGWSF